MGERRCALVPSDFQKKGDVTARSMRTKSNKLIIAIAVLVLLTGIALLLYPTVANIWNERHASHNIANYDNEVSGLDEAYIQEMLERAKAYNAKLVKDVTRWTPSNEMSAEYYECLDITGTGIMGYVTIPKIDVKLPIFHGDSDEVLAQAIGHMEGSSLPVGGEGTHVVISGHTGLPRMKLFTKLDTLVVGDRFTLSTLGYNFEYEVDQIKIVLPHELEYLDIDPDEDYVTLLTCTPYGVNTHRLLVRGHRVADDD